MGHPPWHRPLFRGCANKRANWFVHMMTMCVEEKLLRMCVHTQSQHQQVVFVSVRDSDMAAVLLYPFPVFDRRKVKSELEF